MKKARFGPKNTRSAFTLIELVVVLAIAALLLVVTVPHLSGIYDRLLLEQETRMLEKELIWLRDEAKRTDASAMFQRRSATEYVLVVEKNGVAAQEKRTLSNNRMTLETSSRDGRIVFAPRGTSYEKCTLILRLNDQVRTIVVSNMGRIRVGDEA